MKIGCFLTSSFGHLEKWRKVYTARRRRVGGSGFGKDSENLVWDHMFEVIRFNWSFSLNRKHLSRKKEKSVKREEKQNMLVHTLMIKFGKRSFIFSKDVHIRFWGIVEWSCLELQLVLFVLFGITVQRQKLLIVWDDFTQCINYAQVGHIDPFKKFKTNYCIYFNFPDIQRCNSLSFLV